MRKKSVIFTNKKHPQKGIMSTVFGAIAAVSLALVIYISYRAKGESSLRMGTTTLLAFLLALVGLALGLISGNEPDRYKLFPRLGVLLGGGTMGVIIFITYIAMYRR